MKKQNVLLTAALTALSGVIGSSAVITDASAQATTSWSGAPRTREEDREFKINGRMQYDIFNVEVDNDTDADDYSGSYMRRAFFGVEGRFTQNWRYNVKFDLSPSASSNSDEVRLDDAFLEYAGEDWSFVIGQNNAVSHLEDRTSSNYTPFNERSMIDQAFGFGKIFGAGFVTGGGNWHAGIAVHSDTLNNSQSASTDEPLFVIARGTWAPIYQRTPEGTTLLHLGLSYRSRNGGDSNLSYSARPNQNSNSGLGSTISGGTNFGSDSLWGAEAAFQWNAFGATVEYMQIEGETNPGATADGSGGYVDLFWSPTGESRNYQAIDGSFGRITPRRTLGSDGGIGHVMLSARYEWLDLSDSGFAFQPEQTGYLAGVTWAPLGYVKFQLNYGQYELDRPGSANDREYNTASLRTQFDW